MGVQVRATLLDPAGDLEVYGTGALLRFETSATETGIYVEFATEAINADYYSYEVEHAAGTTTTWYRARRSNAGGTEFSEYGDPFSPGAPAAYATVDDYLLALPAANRPTTRETARIARIERLLARSREQLDLELGFDFGRHPAAGDESWLVDGRGGDLIHAHDGIVSLTTVEVRESISSAWTTVDASDWLLDPAIVATDYPYFHLVTTGAVSRTEWPKGRRLIRLTGVRGWERPPLVAVEANIDWARQAAAFDPTFSGFAQGPPDLGRPTGPAPTRLPDSVWRLKRWHVGLFLGCYL